MAGFGLGTSLTAVTAIVLKPAVTEYLADNGTCIYTVTQWEQTL